MDFGAIVAYGALPGGGDRRTMDPQGDPRYSGSFLGRFYLLGFRAELRTRGRLAAGRPPFPGPKLSFATLGKGEPRPSPVPI